MIDNIDYLKSLPDPQIDVWLNLDRRNFLKKNLHQSIDLILAANCFDRILSSWSEHEILKEVNSCKSLFNDLDIPDLKLDSQKFPPPEWSSYRIPLIEAWSSHHWGHKAESLYLKNKDSLEKLSFCIINVSSQDHAFEIYHRLKAGESSFSDLYRKYDLNKENSMNMGQYEFQPIKMFPVKMHPFLQRMKSGDILKPFANGTSFSVLKMDTWHPALFDEATRRKLLYDEFLNWQQDLLSALRTFLLTID